MQERTLTPPSPFSPAMEWKVVTQPVPGAFTQKIWLLAVEGSRVYSATAGEDGQITLTLVEEGQEHDPLLVLPGHLYNNFCRAFGEHVPQVEKEATQARLEATQEHLADMRKLVFKEQS